MAEDVIDPTYLPFTAEQLRAHFLVDRDSHIAYFQRSAQAYRDGRLTHAEVQRVLAFNSRWETDAFLKQAGAYLDYTEADLENDLASSRRISPA